MPADVASTEDKINLNQRCSGWPAGIGVTDYGITRFFDGSNGRRFTTEDAEDTENGFVWDRVSDPVSGRKAARAA